MPNRIRLYLDFGWLRVKEAAGGTISRANALTAIPGALALLAVVWFWGLKMEAPTDVFGTLALSVAFTVGAAALAWVGIFCFRWIGSPARLYGRIHHEVTQLRSQVKSGIEIIFEERHRAAAWDTKDKNSLMRYVILVLIRNGTGSLLSDCQVQLEIVSHDGPKRPDYVRFFVCEPFSLRPDEADHKAIFEYDFDELNPPIRIPHYHRGKTQWELHPATLLLPPGSHDITVEALSTNTRIARLLLSLRFESGRWEVSERKPKSS